VLAYYAATLNSWLMTRFWVLALVEHVHGFIALNRPLCRGKRPKPQPRIHTAFHNPMILFHRFIQIFSVPKMSASKWRHLNRAESLMASLQ
jgi:hypothetical protein